MNYLNSGQIEKYKKNGFLIVKNVFSIKECDELKQVLIHEIKKGKDIFKKSSTEATKDVDYNKLADIPRLINNGFLQDIAHRNSTFMALAKDSRLISIISQFFGNDVQAFRLYRSLSTFKNSAIISKSKMHQDMPYWKGETNKLSVWISLNKATKHNGCLIFYPGSHTKFEKHSINKKQKGKEAIYMDIKELDESQKVISETDIGDIIIFHSCVIHGSEKNILKEERYSLTFTYQPATDNSHHRNGSAELIEKRANN